MCNKCLSRQNTDGNAAQSRSGSIALSPKFDGPSATTMKFEGKPSGTKG
jgi:hypothetical protein